MARWKGPAPQRGLPGPILRDCVQGLGKSLQKSRAVSPDDAELECAPSRAVLYTYAWYRLVCFVDAF